MDAGTVIAILVPNTVTALALWLTWQAGQQRLIHGRELADLEAVRTVLDQCAIEVRKFLQTISPLTAPGFADRDVEKTEVEEAIAKFYRHGEALDEMADRLRIRFGSGHRVVLTVERMLWAGLEARIATDEVERGEKRPEEVYDKLIDALSRTTNNGHEFFECAQRVAGARLPDPEGAQATFA